MPGSNILSIHDSNGNVITSGTVGEAVFIYGGGFGTSQGSSTVTFNGTPATVNTWTANQINTAVPSGATTGSVVVTVGGVASNGYSFTVTEGSSSNIYYYIDDMLGSSRTIVQDGQTGACYEADFYPFGGERDINVSCVQNYKFEGKERDGETQNDNFGARYYSNRFGRWLSAGWSSVPAPVPYANLTNPQTLNLYGMVSDNPETFADLDGHCGGNNANGVGCQFVAEWNAEHGIESQASQQAAGQAQAAQQQNQTADQRAAQVVFGQVQKEFSGVTFDQNNVQVLGAHNGHENIVVTGTGSKDQVAQVQKALQKNKGFFGPGSRINITIGKGTFALHVERVSATSSSVNFQSHIDRGDPNSGVRGFFTHVFVDGFVGAVFHPHDPGLDPQP